MFNHNELANDTYDDLTRLGHDFINWVRANKLKWIFSKHMLEVPYLVNRIFKFETQGAKLLAELGITDDFKDHHDLLSEFKDLLNDHRPVFISFMEIAKLHSSEDPSDLFNIYTYGGNI